MSCFQGHIVELKNVSVDCFEHGNMYSTAYFLSHCHTDHMKGLTSEVFLKRLRSEAHIYLYCSEITAHILRVAFHFSNVLHKIKVVPLGVSTIVKILDPDGSTEDVTASLIPTGHCPGAVMFMFEGEMGRILYTGDFRLYEGDVSRFRQLHYLDGSVKVIDKLYLDTTFLSHQYMQFPSRFSSISILCNFITSWLQEGTDNNIYIQMPANYGSEAVFVAVAKRLGMKVHVSDKAYNIYKNIAEIREAVTDDPHCTRIHACQPYGWRSYAETTVLPCQGKLSKLRIIKPSAMFFTSKVYDGSLCLYTTYLVRTASDEAYYDNKTQITARLKNFIQESAVCHSSNQNLFRICYSCHCSYRELEHFVKYLKPRQIEACVVPKNMKAADMLQLLKEVSRWGDGSADAPVLTVSGTENTKNGMSTDMSSICSIGLTEQQNRSTSDKGIDVNREGGGHVQSVENRVDAEIYRLIAHDFKPEIGDQDVDIRRSISLEFLEYATSLNKPLV